MIQWVEMGYERSYQSLVNFLKIVSFLHDGMVARMLNDLGSSEFFQVINGVKQGCILAPTLFILMFSLMLTEKFNDSSSGIHIPYRCDVKLFNFRRLQASTKIKKTSIKDPLFADDYALYAITEQEMQRKVD